MSEEIKIENPFVGPRPLTRADRIYGRKTELSKLLQLLDARRIVLLHAPSGAGKTSLIQAGLIPQLEEDDFHVLPIARLHYMPDDKTAISKGFNRYIYSFIVTLEEEQSSAKKGHDSVAKTVPSIVSYLKSRLDALESWSPVVLILDQFEEILKDPIDIPKKEEFFTQLGKALRDLNLWAMFVIRDDYMGALMDIKYVRQIPTRLVSTYHLDLLSKDAAIRAIKCTAEGCDQNGRSADVAEDDATRPKISDDAVIELVDNLRRIKVQRSNGELSEELGPHVEPVHLQVACNRLWKKLPAGTKKITETELKKYGDVDKSLGLYFADEVETVASDPECEVDEREIRYWIQGRLITRKGIRLPVLQESGSTRGLDNKLIENLVDVHLLRKETRGGRIFYELSHDRMVQPVLDNNEEWFDQNLEMLQQRAEEWKRGGYQDYLLLRDDDFQEGKTWAENNKELMTDLDDAFYKVSLEHFQEEEELRLAEERELELTKELLKTEEEQRQTKERELVLAQRLASRNRWLLVLALIILLVGAIASILGITVSQIQKTNIANEFDAEVTAAAIPVAQATSNAAEATATANAAGAEATSEALEGTLSEVEATRLALKNEYDAIVANATLAAAAATEASTNLGAVQATADSQATAAMEQPDDDPMTAASDAAAAATTEMDISATAGAANATIDAANVTATAAWESIAYARFPAGVDISIYDQPGSDEKITVIEGPERLPVLRRSGSHVEVELPSGESGWAVLYWLTFEGGNEEILGQDWKPLFISYPPDLKFVFGTMTSRTQGLRNPNDNPADTDSHSWIVPAKKEVIVLEEAPGNKYYGSGRWLLIYYVDDDRVKKVYVPYENVIER